MSIIDILYIIYVSEGIIIILNFAAQSKNSLEIMRNMRACATEISRPEF